MENVIALVTTVVVVAGLVTSIGLLLLRGTRWDVIERRRARSAGRPSSEAVERFVHGWGDAPDPRAAADLDAARTARQGWSAPPARVPRGADSTIAPGGC